MGDGASLLNILEGALGQLNRISTRHFELASQAANGIYSFQQRQALNTEAQVLVDEYNRIVNTTSFNGVKLLDGSTGENRLQAGYGESGSIAINLAAGESPRTVGDGTFQASGSYTTGVGSSSMLLADFNGDGVLDITTTDTFSNGISVMIGNGNGTFKARTFYGTGAFPFRVTQGDLNGDGALDLVEADNSTSSISIRLGNGNGSFKARTSYATGAVATSVALSDLNGDGILDIATVDDSADRATVMLGNGNGTFKALSSYTTGDGPQSLELADVDNDSILDLITVNNLDNSVSVMLGNGNGTFAARTSYATGNGPTSLTLGDMNGDGLLDLVTVDSYADRVSVMLGNGDGSFKTRTSYYVNFPLDATLGDLNGDGILDLAAASQGDGVVAVFLANTTTTANTFQTPTIDYLDLTSQSSSRQALDVIAETMQSIGTRTGNVGAIQSRLLIALNNLTSARENFAAAESRIRDADIARESSQLSRLGILQRAGAAVLAQANQQPTLALRLLE